MGSFFKECGCSREEAGFGTQDEAIERLTQIYAEKKNTEGPRRARPAGRHATSGAPQLTLT